MKFSKESLRLSFMAEVRHPSLPCTQAIYVWQSKVSLATCLIRLLWREIFPASVRQAKTSWHEFLRFM